MQRYLKVASLVLAGIAIWLAAIEWPIAPTMGVDSSWECALVDAHIHGRQFGTDFQFTYGPWGYVSSHFMLPAALNEKVAWEVVGIALLSATWVLLSLEIPGYRRYLFLAVVAVTANYYETSVLVQIILISLLWLLPRETPSWRILVGLFWLSFFAHQKFTFCILSTSCIAMALSAAAVQSRWLTSVALGIVYCFIYILLWYLGGQHLSNLYAYWRQSFEISRGYSSAMAADPSIPMLSIGLLLIVFIVAAIAIIGRRSKPGQRLATAGILGLGWYLAWKEAFTRADLHTLSLFVYSILAGVALVCMFYKYKDVQFSGLGLIILSVTALSLNGMGFLLIGPSIAWQRIHDRPRELGHLGSIYQRYFDELHRSQRNEDDPILRGLVGRNTIDALTLNNSRIILNRLNYYARPICQSYSAYTRNLDQANAAFFASPLGPEYATVTFSVVDEHPPAEDDGLSLLAIVRGYDFVQFTPDYALVRRNPHKMPGNARQKELIRTAQLSYGETFPAPNGSGHPVWIEVDIQPTILGTLRSLFYHASEITMTVRGTRGELFHYRLIPAIASSGFLLQPWLSNHGDFTRLMLGSANVMVDSLELECIGNGATLFWGNPIVSFYLLRDLPLDSRH